MVAQDQVTAWDLKPNRENTNKIFNVLCNVQPVEHPWSGDGYARQIDVTTGSKDQFWLEKCKGLKRCKLYEYECYSDGVHLVVPEDVTEEGDEQAKSKKRRNERLRSNANFTDVIVFQGYRIYMRKNNPVLNPYGRNTKSYNGKQYVDDGGDNNKDTCDEGDRPSNVIEDYSIDKTITTAKDEDGKISTFNTADRIRIYIQQVDTKECTGDTFDGADEAPIILVKEYEAASCNPDHFVMGYGGIGTPIIFEDGVMYIIYYGGQTFAYLVPNRDVDIKPTDYIYIKGQGIYISGLTKPEENFSQILTELDIPLGGYAVPQISELISGGIYSVPELREGQSGGYTTSATGEFYVFSQFGEVPYFVAGNSLYSLNGFFALEDDGCNLPDEDDIYYVPTEGKIKDNMYKGTLEDVTECDAESTIHMKRRIFIFDNEITTSTISKQTPTGTITGLTRWGASLAFISGDNIYVSGYGAFTGIFSAWTIPVGVTDVRSLGGSLLMFGPKSIYAVANEDMLKAGAFVSGTDNDDGYYSPGSFYNDDGEFLLVRRGKVLGTLNLQIGYSNSVSLSFEPSTGFYVNSHFKSLNNEHDLINIDANINNRYISIYDNNDTGVHYSKLLIYDKHYNFWYHWMITGARIVHVKDNIFLGDGVYVNKGRTRGRRTDDTKGGEIIEIISAYVGEEGLQTPKHIQYIKTAIGDHSKITNNSLWDIDMSYGGKLFQRRVDITTTRYPRLLFSKDDEKVIESYEIGEEIYGHGKLLSHNLLNEISEYRNYDKFSDTIIREMGENIDYKSKLALFASIKEPINAPANVLELCISARKLDNVQFGSFYIGYYVLDPDYEDIENTNIDKSDFSDRTKEASTVINKGEYCDEVLAGSACDTFNS